MKSGTETHHVFQSGNHRQVFGSLITTDVIIIRAAVLTDSPLFIEDELTRGY